MHVHMQTTNFILFPYRNVSKEPLGMPSNDRANRNMENSSLYNVIDLATSLAIYKVDKPALCIHFY